MRGRASQLASALILGPAFVLATSIIHAQTADEHASHHPEQAAAGPNAPGSAGTMSGGSMGIGGMSKSTGMGDMNMGSADAAPFPPAMNPAVMEQMMKRMGVPPPRDLYPALMAMDELSEENRATAGKLAHDRMQAGTAMMADAFAKLRKATERNDLAAMDEATQQIHQGMSRYQAGVSAHRLLQEGQAPQAVAMQWFKSEMNLLPTQRPQDRAVLFGMSSFHTGIMAILLAFALFASWMYGVKMRRAASLLTDLSKGRVGAEADGYAGVLTHPREAPGAQNPTTPLSRRETWLGSVKVIGIFPETPGVKTFRLAMPNGSPLPFAYEPGQFATLTLHPDSHPDGIKRSYTIASSPSQRDYFELTIKREPQGLCSRFMHDAVSVGDELQVQTPLGRFYFNGTTADRVVLMAGGVGITPMMSALRYLTAHCWPGRIHLLFFVKTPDDIIFREEIERLEVQFDNVNTHISVTQPGETGWKGATGRVSAEMILSVVPDIASYPVHICGPQAMMDAAKAELQSLGVPTTAIKTEAFGTEIKSERVGALARTPAAAAAAGQFEVQFTLAERTAKITADQIVLDAADDAGVSIDRSCLAGTCGACIVKLSSGEVSMAVEDALEPDEKAAGYILACQAKPKSNISVDA